MFVWLSEKWIQYDDCEKAEFGIQLEYQWNSSTHVVLCALPQLASSQPVIPVPSI